MTTAIARIPVVWSGLPGLPGLSVFYSLGTGSSAAVADLVTFFGAIKAKFPPGLSWTIPSSGDLLIAEDGSLSGSWSGASGSTVSSTGTSATYAAGVGARVSWSSDVIVGRRRLKGRTFLVPLTSDNYQSNGTMNDATVTSFQAAADAVVAGGNLRIWARPSRGGSDGAIGPVMAAIVPDEVSVLRSRRT